MSYNLVMPTITTTGTTTGTSTNVNARWYEPSVPRMELQLIVADDPCTNMVDIRIKFSCVDGNLKLATRVTRESLQDARREGVQRFPFTRDELRQKLINALEISQAKELLDE